MSMHSGTRIPFHVEFGPTMLCLCFRHSSRPLAMLFLNLDKFSVCEPWAAFKGV